MNKHLTLNLHKAFDIGPKRNGCLEINECRDKNYYIYALKKIVVPTTHFHPSYSIFVDQTHFSLVKNMAKESSCCGIIDSNVKGLFH